MALHDTPKIPLSNKLKGTEKFNAHNLGRLPLPDMSLGSRPHDDVEDAVRRLDNI